MASLLVLEFSRHLGRRSLRGYGNKIKLLVCQYLGSQISQILSISKMEKE